MTTTARPREGLQPSRRTIVRGAAWSVPVIAAATTAPAFAASPCDTPLTGTVSFAQNGNYRRSSAAFGTANVTMSDGSTLGVTFTSTMTAGYSRDARNFVAGSASAFPGSLALVQVRNDGNNAVTRGQDVLIEFDRPVFNVVLPLSAFSYPANNYRDAAWVDPAPSAGTIVNGSNVTGNGTTGSPFRNPSSGSHLDIPYSGPTTRTTMTFGGGTAGLSSIKIHYLDFNTGTGHDPQGMAVENFSFEAKPVGCA
jgi:hypothetical protein